MRKRKKNTTRRLLTKQMRLGTYIRATSALCFLKPSAKRQWKNAKRTKKRSKIIHAAIIYQNKCNKDQGKAGAIPSCLPTRGGLPCNLPAICHGANTETNKHLHCICTYVPFRVES